jgi:hypothetical protein
MIPIDSEFLAWLDDEGHMRKDAPERVKKAHQEWLEHMTELDRLNKQQEGL